MNRLVRKCGLSLAVVATLSVLPAWMPPTRAAAAEHEKWRLQFDMVVVNIRGADQAVGTLIVRDTSGPTTLETSSEIFAELDSDFSGRLTYEWTPGRWGLGVTGWVYDGADSNYDEILSSDSANGIETILRSDALLAETVAPDTGMRLRATSHFKLASIEVAAIRDLALSERSWFFFTAGLRLVQMTDTRAEDLTGPTPAFHVSESEADILAGPVLGFHGRAQWRRHRVEGFLRQSVVMGNGTYEAVYFEQSATPILSHWSDSREIAIPITEIDMRWSYDVNRRWSLGLGYFASIWWDAPLAPIGNTGAGPASTNESTVVVSGPAVSVVWRAAAKK